MFGFFIPKVDLQSRDMPNFPNPIFTLIQLGFLPNFKGLVKIRKTGVTTGRSTLSVGYCSLCVHLDA